MRCACRQRQVCALAPPVVRSAAEEAVMSSLASQSVVPCSPAESSACNGFSCATCVSYYSTGCMIRTIWLATKIQVFHIWDVARQERTLSVASAHGVGELSLGVPADDVGRCAGQLARRIVVGAGCARHGARRGAHIVARGVLTAQAFPDGVSILTTL